MFKYKGGTKSFKKENKGLDCKWWTFKDGDIIPEDVVELVKSQGGEIVIAGDIDKNNFITTEEVEEMLEKDVEEKSEVLVKEVDEEIEENPFLDDYLNRNASVVKTNLEKDNLSEEDLKSLLELEKENKKRSSIIKYIKKRLKKID